MRTIGLEPRDGIGTEAVAVETKPVQVTGGDAGHRRRRSSHRLRHRSATDRGGCPGVSKTTSTRRHAGAQTRDRGTAALQQFHAGGQPPANRSCRHQRENSSVFDGTGAHGRRGARLRQSTAPARTASARRRRRRPAAHASRDRFAPRSSAQARECGRHDPFRACALCRRVQVAVVVRGLTIADEHVRPPGFERVERVSPLTLVERTIGAALLRSTASTSSRASAIFIEHQHADAGEHRSTRAGDRRCWAGWSCRCAAGCSGKSRTRTGAVSAGAGWRR